MELCALVGSNCNNCIVMQGMKNVNFFRKSRRLSYKVEKIQNTFTSTLVTRTRLNVTVNCLYFFFKEKGNYNFIYFFFIFLVPCIVILG